MNYAIDLTEEQLEKWPVCRECGRLNYDNDIDGNELIYCLRRTDECVNSRWFHERGLNTPYESEEK